MKYYIGVDVGTGSARAGIFDENGQQLGLAKQDISMTKPAVGWAEQSTKDIWNAVCFAVKTALKQSGLTKDQITAIGFDATCSLAIADQNFNPLSLADDDVRDVIVWMDQRATKEADDCNATKAEPLRYVGGKMSPEMQMPKLLWLKRHRPDLWERLAYAGDLSDWLTRKATGKNDRSICTLTCKWGFMPHHAECWDLNFLRQIDLLDVLDKAQLPPTAKAVGDMIGTLTNKAAKDLGLHQNCIVSSGMIDAHAGAVMSFALLKEEDIPQSLGLVAGTSNCHMALHPEMLSINGVWGPYQGVVKENYWLNEGGQTATGALLEHLIQSYRGADAFLPNIHQNVSDQLFEIYQRLEDPAPTIHLLPDFIGNRSPHADPNFRGVISGLTFTSPEDTFKEVYWGACCAIAYGTRAIMERMEKYGYQFKQIVLTGGHSKSPLLTQLYADATGCDVLIPNLDEPVLLGSAMTACAASHQGDFSFALSLLPKMHRVKANPNQKTMHDNRYKIFTSMYENFPR